MKIFLLWHGTPVAQRLFDDFFKHDVFSLMQNKGPFAQIIGFKSAVICHV